VADDAARALAVGLALVAAVEDAGHAQNPAATEMSSSKDYVEGATDV
jgi:hypothetical protein